MNMNRFEPLGLMRTMQRNAATVRLHRLPVSAEASDACGPGTDADWIPAVDIVEDEKRFVLHADVPGIDPQKIEINAEKGTLTLSGERSVEESLEVDGMRRVERVSGKFLRKFSLPDNADADTIVASSKHGTLQIVIPKHEPESRRISVAPG